MKLSAVLITLNEKENIEACLKTLQWADQIVVVDGGSKDGTPEIAKKLGALVIHHVFLDFASQRNFALAEAAGDWVLFVDADERITPALRGEIQNLMRQNPVPALYRIPRKTFFFRQTSSLEQCPSRCPNPALSQRRREMDSARA